MGDPRHKLGRDAETAVASWLTSLGWRIIARRITSPGGGEVDLVALDPQEVLVAIEVRARRTRRAGAAADSIVERHVARMRNTLVAVAVEAGRRHNGLRVDLVSVEPAAGEPGRWLARHTAGIG
ncbi:MAG: YraN family protein [Chloroflexi bacterium]|nr:YraN family protein [Chloroflexota bacterium]